MHKSDVIFAPCRHLSSFGDRIRYQIFDPPCGSLVDDGAQHRRAFCWIAQCESLRLCGQSPNELIGYFRVDDNAFGRHADLALVEKGPEGRSVDCSVQVGVVEDDHWSFAAEFEEDRLQIASSTLGHDATDASRPRKVDVPDCRMVNQGAHQCFRICGSIGKYIDDAVGESGILESGSDQPMYCGT